MDAVDGRPAPAAPKLAPKAPVKAETPKESADRETRDVDRGEKQQQKEKEKEVERKSDGERENRKFRNQIVQDREVDARRKEADRENDRFLAQIERDRPKDTMPKGNTCSVKAWETAQQVAKDAGAARATAYDLAATRNKGATGSVRAWETTAQLADEAELAAQKLKYVRDVGLPQTPLPPASFQYNKNVVSPNYAGDAAETIEGVDWQRFPAAPGGLPVGFTKDGSKVVVALAAVHRRSATPRRVVQAAAAHAKPERKRFVVQAAEQELTKIKTDLAQLRKSLQSDIHRKHDAKPSRDQARRKKAVGHEKAAPIRKQVVPPKRPVREAGPCKTVRTSSNGTGTSSSSTATVCGSGSVRVG